MSYRNPLLERERALEDAFFQKETKRLLDALHGKQSQEEQADALSKAMNIDNPKIVGPLIDAGLRASNLTALIMAPLVSVAWADGTMNNEERKLLIASSIALGLEPSSEGATLVEAWLSHPPHPELFEAWRGCIQILCEELFPSAADELRREILSRAHRIALAMEKSFLRGGGGGPTQAEKAIITRIESAFLPEPLR